METVYFICAIAGGAVLVCQLALTLLGMEGDHDGDAHAHIGTGAPHHPAEPGHDADASWSTGVLTFRTIVAAVTFFGIAGMAASTSGVAPLPTLAISIAVGGLALFLVAWLMQSLYGLSDDGTVSIQSVIGRPGTVYVTIPGQRLGRGKVMVSLQERTVELEAVTAHAELPSGSHVVVVGILGSDAVEVAPAPEPARTTHA